MKYILVFDVSGVTIGDAISKMNIKLHATKIENVVSIESLPKTKGVVHLRVWHWNK